MCAVTYLRQKSILAADAVELAVVVQVMLQRDGSLEGAGDEELPLLCAAHPVRELHHIWNSGREQDEVHMRRKHDDDLHVCQISDVTCHMRWRHDDDLHVCGHDWSHKTFVHGTISPQSLASTMTMIES